MPSITTPYISERPGTYEPDYVWSRTAQLWGEYPTILLKSGGRYKNQLVVVGIDIDEGVIYYSEI